MACVVDHVLRKVQLAHRRGVDVPEPVKRKTFRALEAELVWRTLEEFSHCSLSTRVIGDRVFEHGKVAVSTPKDEVRAR